MHKSAVAANEWEVRGRIARAMQWTAGAVAFVGLVLVLLPGEKSKAAGWMALTIGIGLAALSWTFLGAFEKLALVRLIQDLPTANIRSAAQGYVELHGTVGPGDESLQCPKCGQRCLWFQCHVKKRRYVPSRHPDIVLDDGTGQCLVKAQGAELFTIDGDAHVHICVGDPLFVLGEFRTLAAAVAPQPATAARETLQPRAEDVRRKLLQIRYDARRMAVFDVNRDGKLDERELEAARRVVERQAEGAPAQPAARPDHVIAQPRTDADRLPFVIVVGDEHDAVKAARSAVWARSLLVVVASGFVGLFLLAGFEQVVDMQAGRDLAGAQRQQAPKPAAPPQRQAHRARERPAPTPRQQAMDLHRAGRLDDAVAAYDALIDEAPGDAELHFWRANALGQMGRQDEAVDGMRRACELGKAEACDIVERRTRSD